MKQIYLLLSVIAAFLFVSNALCCDTPSCGHWPGMDDGDAVGVTGGIKQGRHTRGYAGETDKGTVSRQEDYSMPVVFNNVMSKYQSVLKNSEQLLIVTGDYASPKATLYVLSKSDGKWQMSYPQLEVNIGKNGFAHEGKKREGDGMTPSGAFYLGTAFGYEPSIATKMPYCQSTAEDFWVDDSDSPQYNQWVHGKPDAKSWEVMRREDNLYKYGAVIEYNTSPVVKGAGSAIFIHVQRGEDMPTAGCVSMPEACVAELLGWLDPAKIPLIVTGTLE
jgi:L,D-peptidoglycan transpeptidase YkuD (ErfK/YbiS/YcfS/YnhG family)